jgi:hypothetical protein
MTITAIILGAAAVAVLMLRFRYRILIGAGYLIALASSLGAFAGILFLAITPPWHWIPLAAAGAALGAAFYLDAKREAQRKRAERTAEAIRADRAERGIELPYT